jgi:hypothetical protein
MVTTDALYFADASNGTINKAGVATPLATNEMGATMLQQVATNLYWYDAGSRKIRQMATTGGPASDVYTNTAIGVDGGIPPDLGGFLVSPDGLTLYISLGNQVLKTPVAGGAFTVVAQEAQQGRAGALALNGTMNIVYPFGSKIEAPLLNLPGGAPAICGAPDPTIPGGTDMTTCPRLSYSAYSVLRSFIAVVAGHAYWIDEFNVLGELIGPRETAFDLIASGQGATITAAAATADAIYFADADPFDPTRASAQGFIEKTALAPNSAPILLARGLNSPMAIAVDSTKVYWANADCSIMSQNR